MRKRLMFTGGGGAGNEAIYRLWHDHYDLFFADADADAIDPSIPRDRCRTIPFAERPMFADSVAAVCRDEAIDVLIPGVDEELRSMPVVAAAAPATEILIPEAAFVAQSIDKLATARSLAAHGLPAPATVTMEDVDGFAFPCLAKPRRGRGSRGVRVLASRIEAAAYLQLSGQPADAIVLQEYLQGREFTVMMAADRQGNLHAVVPVEVGVKRGITIRAWTRMDDNVIAGCRAIHDAFTPRGCYNIQLILTENGRAVPFEINPRVSTTFCLGIAAGVDPVDIFYRTAAPSSLLLARDGLGLNRHWTNVIH